MRKKGDTDRATPAKLQLIRERLAEGWTQARIAGELGVTRQAVQQLVAKYLKAG